MVASVLLLAATVATGLVAGAFALGLGRVEDRTFVVAVASLDRAIINPWFMVGGFVGAPVLTAAAALALWAEPAFGLLCWALVEAGHR